MLIWDYTSISCTCLLHDILVPGTCLYNCPFVTCTVLVDVVGDVVNPIFCFSYVNFDVVNADFFFSYVNFDVVNADFFVLRKF